MSIDIEDNNINWDDPYNWMTDEKKLDLKKFVDNILEENAYTPDTPEIFRKKSQLVFVYGTLRKGFTRAGYLRGSTYLGSGFTTQNNYVLYTKLSKTDPFPVMMSNFGSAKGQVYGELYRVDSDIIPYLDFMEANGNLYDRKEIPVYVKTAVGYVQCNAWCYLADYDAWSEAMRKGTLEIGRKISKRGSSTSDYYIWPSEYKRKKQEEAA